MITKRASKTLSLFLAFCMVFTMLPTVAFAETSDVDSGVPLGVAASSPNLRLWRMILPNKMLISVQSKMN